MDYFQEKFAPQLYRKKNKDKYYALNTIASLLKLIGVIGIFVAVLGLIAFIGSNSGPLVFVYIIVALFVLLQIFAAAEIIGVFLDIEENTRRTKELLEKNSAKE